ncbi:MAG: type II secretion system F family protein [Alphaproteobacteria bacterium]|nr:MAG: type II secretion system F family protein [Alphaproteobacteria bacterium]
MDIWNRLEDQLGPMGPYMVLVGIAALLVVSALVIYLRQRPDPLERLKAQARPQAATAEAGRPRLRNEDPAAKAAKKLDRFADFLEPQDQSEFSATQLKLLQAGYRGKGVVRTFHFAQFALGMIGLVLGVLYALLTSDGAVKMQSVLLSVIIPGGAGYYLPIYWVERRRQTRQQEILEGFPDALDLLLVCVEAGQSLDQAIIRVSEEIKTSYPALAEELAIVAYEMKAGKDKQQVLRDFSERAGVPDVASFVTVLIQSATFGTPISDALRVFSSEMRDKRVMRAEEKANTLPTKLTLGTMMFTVPPLLIILIGPSVYNIIKVFGSGAIGGGG